MRYRLCTAAVGIFVCFVIVVCFFVALFSLVFLLFQFVVVIFCYVSFIVSEGKLFVRHTFFFFFSPTV